MFKIISKNKIKKPKAIILDTDNTLYPYDLAHSASMKEVTKKAKDLIGVNEEIFLELFNLSRSEIKKKLGNTASSHSRLLYFQRTIEKLELGTQIFLTLDLEQTYWRTFLDHSVLSDGVLNFLQKIRADGVKTANITDLTAQIQFRKMVYFGLDELFDFVVTSEEAGADKPSKLAFELVLEKLKLDVKDIWMVGDNPISDIDGGVNAGLYSIQLKTPNTSISRNADAVFSHFDSLYKTYESL